jgi:hypothetical protein
MNQYMPCGTLEGKRNSLQSSFEEVMAKVHKSEECNEIPYLRSSKYSTRMNPKRYTQRNIMIKKTENFERSKKKQLCIYKIAPIPLSDFSVETLQARRSI